MYGFNYGIIAGDGNKENHKDLIQSFKSQGLNYVEIIDTTNRTPLMHEIKQYDALFCYSWCEGFYDGEEMGDLLYQYSKLGKGLVMLSSLFIHVNSRNQIKGKIVEEQLGPFENGTNSLNSHLTLGEIVMKDHPIVKDVKSFDGGSESAHGKLSLSSEAYLIAKWSNGQPLISYLEKENFGKVVGLNFWPISNRINFQNWWDESTDGALIMTNSLRYVSNNFK